MEKEKINVLYWVELKKIKGQNDQKREICAFQKQKRCIIKKNRAEVNNQKIEIAPGEFRSHDLSLMRR